MSEVVNPGEVVLDEIEDATVVQAPIDDTLTLSGYAADAKTVGDRFDELVATAALIPVSDDPDSPSVQAAIEELQSRTGDDIQLHDGDTTTLADALAGMYTEGGIIATDSSTPPEIGVELEEVTLPATWGDILNGTRSYEADGVTGEVHLWRVTGQAEEV